MIKVSNYQRIEQYISLCKHVYILINNMYLKIKFRFAAAKIIRSGQILLSILKYEIKEKSVCGKVWIFSIGLPVIGLLDSSI
jgi:hypothetical protein